MEELPISKELEKSPEDGALESRVDKEGLAPAKELSVIISLEESPDDIVDSSTEEVGFAVVEGL